MPFNLGMTDSSKAPGDAHFLELLGEKMCSRNLCTLALLLSGNSSGYGRLSTPNKYFHSPLEYPNTVECPQDPHLARDRNIPKGPHSYLIGNILISALRYKQGYSYLSISKLLPSPV